MMQTRVIILAKAKQQLDVSQKTLGNAAFLLHTDVADPLTRFH
jgi:hypothetical protein